MKVNTKHSLKYSLLFIFLAIGCTAKAQVLDVPVCSQEQSRWCWAASAQCILAYTGKFHEQCELVEYQRTQDPDYYGTTNCCSMTTFPASAPSCNLINSLYNTAKKTNVRFTIWEFNLIDNSGYDHALTLEEVRNEIKGYNPFFINWTGDGSGHIAVVHGIEEDILYIMDPKPENSGGGKKMWAYDDAKTYDDLFTWNYTLTTKSPYVVCDDTLLVTGTSTELSLKNAEPDGEWLSSDKNIAEVSTEGVVKALKVGEATITYKAETGQITSKKISVTDTKERE